MSSAVTSDPTQTSTPKSKKHKKRKGGAKGKTNVEPIRTNGVKNDGDPEQDDPEVDEPETPTSTRPPDMEPPTIPSNHENELQLPNGNSATLNAHGDEAATGSTNVNESNYKSNTPSPTSLRSNSPVATNHDITPASITLDIEASLDALATERSALRDEVTQLRRSLEQMQGKHDQELGTVREQLREVQGEREHAETQYRNLLGKVNTIRSQLGERLKADAEDLAQARSHIEDLEDQNATLREQTESRTAELATLAAEGEQRSKELSVLRNRTTLSQQDWAKEREDLIQREAYAREEFEAAKQAMQSWEILAVDERSIRESLAERVADLEEQVSTHREGLEKVAAERDTQSLTVDGLQRALQEIQEARRRELRELVENSQAQIESLRRQLQEAESRANEATTSLESLQKELERALPFEKEVKEKNLLIGKLRHEAVILNDHLTKALRYLKKGKPEDNIDKQIVTNHFLHFLALERADPKKFQVLQIISAMLGWTEEQREQAGLVRPGASNPNLKTPISPWHRTPSTPSLSTDFPTESPNRKESKESLAALWSDFLEQEAQEGTKSSRSTSISSKERAGEGGGRGV